MGYWIITIYLVILAFIGKPILDFRTNSIITEWGVLNLILLLFFYFH